MKVIRKVELKPGSYEEELPGISAEFPYIASYVELDKCAGRQSPWHWHKEVELFYMEQGSLEYDTPQGRTVFGWFRGLCEFKCASYVQGKGWGGGGYPSSHL